MRMCKCFKSKYYQISLKWVTLTRMVQNTHSDKKNWTKPTYSVVSMILAVCFNH